MEANTPVDTAAVPNSASKLIMELDEQENPFSMFTYEDMQLSSVSTYMEDRPPSTPLGSEESNSHEQNMAILDHFLPAPAESASPSHGVVFDELHQVNKEERRKQKNRQSAKRSRDRQKQERLKINQTHMELLQERACLKEGKRLEEVSLINLQTILSAIVLENKVDVDNDIHVHNYLTPCEKQVDQEDELQVILDDLVKISPGLNLRPLDPGDHEEIKKLKEVLQSEAPPNFRMQFNSSTSTLQDSSVTVPSGCRYDSVNAARLTVGENVSLSNNATISTNSVQDSVTMKESPWVTDVLVNEDYCDLMNSWVE